MRPLPMLAVAGQPFDSDAHLFEVKWDGIRALAEVAASRWALWGRAGVDFRKTPEFHAGLPCLLLQRRGNSVSVPAPRWAQCLVR